MTTDVIPDWNSQPLRVARSRGGVMAICDVRRALLHDRSAEWPPPALSRKLKKSGQIAAFDPAGADELTKGGFYCDLQSLASEDAMTWSFFGPFLAAPKAARAALLNWLLELAQVEHEPDSTCEIHLWRRLSHPDTKRTSHGPEPDFALLGDRALVLGEAKRSAKEDLGQGVLGNTSQMEMRRASLASEAERLGGGRELVALGIVLSESLEPPPPDVGGISTRIVEWAELAAYPAHPGGDEFARYYRWKLAHLPRRPPQQPVRRREPRPGDLPAQDRQLGRSTRISSSFERSLRASSTTSSSRRRTTTYTNDHNNNTTSKDGKADATPPAPVTVRPADPTCAPTSPHSDVGPGVKSADEHRATAFSRPGRGHAVADLRPVVGPAPVA